MNIVSKFLLVCLQLIIISLMSLKTVEGREVRSRVINERVNRLPESVEPLTGPLTYRTYYLYSRCSRRNVLVQDRVSATANRTDFKGVLEFQTLMEMAGGVKTRIHGLYSDRYICFNHKGRLVTKPKKRARGAKCEFVEELTPYGYSQFRSAKNADWLIGFNPKGKPLLATAHTMAGPRSKDCFDFLKLGSLPHPPHHRHRHTNVNRDSSSSSSSSNNPSRNNNNSNNNNINNNHHALRHHHDHQNNSKNTHFDKDRNNIFSTDRGGRRRHCC